jgi:hypothetical protein
MLSSFFLLHACSWICGLANHTGQIVIMLVVAPCSFVDVFQCFPGAHCLHIWSYVNSSRVLRGYIGVDRTGPGNIGLANIQ